MDNDIGNVDYETSRKNNRGNRNYDKSKSKVQKVISNMESVDVPLVNESKRVNGYF